MDIIETMATYGLTLKCYPTHEVHYMSYRGQTLKEGETLVDVTFKNGEVVKRIKCETFRAPLWGCKIGNWPHWTKHDFYGSTPEEAISKAVEHIA